MLTYRRSCVVIKRIHLLSTCSLLSAEFGAVLEGSLFSTYAGVYKSMQFWPHPLIKILMLSACSVLGACFVVAQCHKCPRLITSFYGSVK